MHKGTPVLARTNDFSSKWQLGVLFLCALTFAPPASATGDFMVNSGGGEFNVKVKTFSDRRFTKVVKQQYDYSCGSAAVATLLTHHYDYPVDEMTVLNAMFAQGDQEKIHREGFSLLDMKQYLNSLGYNAEGYKESLDKLAGVGIPAIVLINKRGFLHFVVVKGVDKEKVAVGDPTTGINIYSREEFSSMWNNILFVITDKKGAGKSSFNTKAAWKPFGSPNFRNMLDTGQLGGITLNTAFSPNYY